MPGQSCMFSVGDAPRRALRQVKPSIGPACGTDDICAHQVCRRPEAGTRACRLTHGKRRAKLDDVASGSLTSINTQTSATGHSGNETDMGRIVMSRSARVSLFVPLFAWLCMIGVALAASTPQPESESGVSYITGGIGEDEVQVFRAAAPQYNLRMTFTSTSGSYLSDVDVTITAGAGRHVLAVRTEGPFLFVRMPAGDYRVSVHTPARSESRNIHVPKRGAVDLHFSWDDPDAPGVLHLCKHCPRPNRR